MLIAESRLILSRLRKYGKKWYSGPNVVTISMKKMCQILWKNEKCHYDKVCISWIKVEKVW